MSDNIQGKNQRACLHSVRVAPGDISTYAGGSGGVDIALLDGKVFLKYPSGFVQGFAVALP